MKNQLLPVSDATTDVVRTGQIALVIEMVALPSCWLSVGRQMGIFVQDGNWMLLSREQ